MAPFSNGPNARTGPVASHRSAANPQAASAAKTRRSAVGSDASRNARARKTTAGSPIASASRWNAERIAAAVAITATRAGGAKGWRSRSPREDATRHSPSPPEPSGKIFAGAREILELPFVLAVKQR